MLIFQIAYLSAFGDYNNPIFNGTADNSTVEIDGLPNDPGLPPASKCSDDFNSISPSLQSANDSDNATQIIKITGMADNSSYPAEYLANLTQWLQEDLASETTSGVAFLPTRTTSSTGK